MRRIGFVLGACGMLLTACPKRVVIPDPSVPHEVAEETTAYVWVRTPEGKLSKQKVKVLPGWWLASPEVVR